MHEIPGKQRFRQGEIGMRPGGSERVSVQVNAALQISPLRQVPGERDGLFTDLGLRQQVTIPGINPLAKGAAGFIQSIVESRFE